jgi:hypothetical protein
MPFPALSVGVEVPTRCFSGTVHSLFSGACNLGIGLDTLLTLLPSEKGNVPCGIRLDDDSFHTILDRVMAGQPVACRSGLLRFGGPDLTIDLRRTNRWHLDLTSLQLDLRRLDRRHAWTAAWTELITHRCSDGLSVMIGTRATTAEEASAPVIRATLGQRGGQAVVVLLDGTATLRLDHAVTAIQSMIGLGPGLTPSGDDFLVGYLAGLWSTAGNDLARWRFLTTLGSWLSAAAATTNAISGAYLHSAVRGNVSEPIAILARQLACARDPEPIRAATRAALSVGHTSGTDGVLGLLLGCIAWAPEMKLNDLCPGFNA